MTIFEGILDALKKKFGWKAWGIPIWLIGFILILCTRSDNRMADTITNAMWFTLLIPIVFLPTKRKDGN